MKNHIEIFTKNFGSSYFYFQFKLNFGFGRLINHLSLLTLIFKIDYNFCCHLNLLKCKFSLFHGIQTQINIVDTLLFRYMKFFIHFMSLLFNVLLFTVLLSLQLIVVYQSEQTLKKEITTLQITNYSYQNRAYAKLIVALPPCVKKEI